MREGVDYQIGFVGPDGESVGIPNDLPSMDEPCVCHLTGVGRHFHDATPPTYPPQDLLWWLVYNAEKQRNGEACCGAPLFLRSSALPHLMFLNYE